MSQYVKSSTENPYGSRPWLTSLYTGFENYAFLKQPQNTITRESQSVKPRIYAPPEMKKGLSGVTLVGGSGRVLRRARSLGAVEMISAGYNVPRPVAQPVYSTPRTFFVPPPPPPPVYFAQPIYVPPVTSSPAVPAPAPVTAPVVAPPPSALNPPAPAPIMLPAPVSVDAGAPAPAAAAAPSSDSGASPTSSFMDWFNSATLISSIPNGYLLIGGGLVLFMFGKKRR